MVVAVGEGGGRWSGGGGGMKHISSTYKTGSPDNVDKLDGGDVIHFVCDAIQTIHGSIRRQKGFQFRQITIPTAYQIYGSFGAVVPVACKQKIARWNLNDTLPSSSPLASLLAANSNKRPKDQLPFFSPSDPLVGTGGQGSEMPWYNMKSESLP